MSAGQETVASTVPVPQQLWPVFEGRSAAGLARYVSPGALAGRGLAVEDVSRGADGAAEDLVRARDLFEALRAEKLRYDREPWAGLGRQQIRHPEWLLKDRWGTCLDLAVVYAAMCLRDQIAPLLGITDTHAFVVLEPGRLRRSPVTRPFARPWAATLERGVVRVTDPAALIAEVDAGTLVPVDVVNATVGRGGFERAIAAARAHLAEGLRLVDVERVQQAADFEPLGTPLGRPAVREMLPPRLAERATYRGHEQLREELSRADGIVALHGPPGQGKSTVALEVALSAPAGAAWFLNASDLESLRASLAAADLAEVGRDRGSLDAPDRLGYAQDALARLHEAEGRWIVVLDNADGDPVKLAPLMPRPQPGQLVLVTTTSGRWGRMPGVVERRLPPLDDDEVDDVFCDEAMRELVAGRALLLHAFAQLRANLGLSVAEIKQHVPPTATASERGPAALWSAVRTGLSLTEAELGTCLRLAYLPPDHVPSALVRELGSRADDLVERLRAVGLLADSGEGVKLHRLFGRAIRTDLAADLPRDRAAVVHVAGLHAARATLDRHGDLPTVLRLDERLAHIDRSTVEPDDALGTALHGIGELLELKGHTKRSGVTYELAWRHLDGRAHLRADVLHSRARTVNQAREKTDAEIREAIGWAREAEALLDGPTASGDRCVAMQGLLTQKLAKQADTARAIAIYREARELIELADARRVARLGKVDPDHPELARSKFNKAGFRIGLAQRQPELARTLLQEAYEIYEDVLEWRQHRIYGRRLHPHIAACIIGLGYVDYYRATLLPSTPEQRSEWLRSATEHATEALGQRSILDGAVDGDEAAKAAQFLAKVAAARSADRRFPDKVLDKIQSDARRELVFGAVQTLPAHGRELDDAIRDWICSPALRVLLEQFGGRAPTAKDVKDKLGEVLVELEAFSACWDFRSGQERNLAVGKDFDPKTADTIRQSAAALGLVGTRPPQFGEYDHVLILGGLVRACLARPLYAAKLLAEGTVTTTSVTALGGFRALGGNEHDLAANFGLAGLEDEFDAMDAGVRRAFEVAEPVAEDGERSSEIGASWAVRTYAQPDAKVAVIAAPSSEPGVRRANTADTYEWFARERAKLRGGERILVVTTDIYVPFQHADALRMLAIPYDVEVDAVGIRPAEVDERLDQQFAPHNYLQEMRSTIRALRQLQETAADR